MDKNLQLILKDYNKLKQREEKMKKYRKQFYEVYRKTDKYKQVIANYTGSEEYKKYNRDKQRKYYENNKEKIKKRRKELKERNFINI